MQVNGRSLGVLSLFGSRVEFGDHDEDSASLARVFAAHAALANASEVSGLTTGLSSRDLIGQAKGVLMERFGLTAETAFAVQVRTSSHTNTKLRVVCEQLTDTGILKPVPPRTSD